MTIGRCDFRSGITDNRGFELEGELKAESFGSLVVVTVREADLKSASRIAELLEGQRDDLGSRRAEVFSWI